MTQKAAGRVVGDPPLLGHRRHRKEAILVKFGEGLQTRDRAHDAPPDRRDRGWASRGQPIRADAHGRSVARALAGGERQRLESDHRPRPPTDSRGWVSPHLGTVWIKRLPVEQLKRFYSYLRQPIHLGRLAVPPPSPPLRPPFVFHPTDAKVYPIHEWLWAGTEGAGLWLSQNNGDTWQFAGLPRRTVYTVLFDPLQPDRLVAATDRGIFAVEVAQD